MVAAKDKAYLGNIGVKVDIPNFLFTNREQLREFRRTLYAAHQKGIKKGVDILQKILSRKKFFDTGALRDSVDKKLFRRTVDIFSGDVHFNKPGLEYAYFVEHGRGAGLPPPYTKMVEWGERKGLSYEKTMAIRNKIALKGTKARPFMDEATTKIEENYNKIVDAAIVRFIKRIK